MTAPDLPAALTNRTAFLLRLALARVEADGERVLAGLGLTGREYGVLALLEHGPSSAQHRLGAVLGVDRTSTVALLAGLQDRGLLDRSPDPADRRAHRVALTGPGEAVRRRAAAALADCEERFLEPLTADERHRLRGTLQRLVGS